MGEGGATWKVAELPIYLYIVHRLVRTEKKKKEIMGRKNKTGKEKGKVMKGRKGWGWGGEK
jgi:hypothetical protein